MLTRNAIGNLVNRYRSVLNKCRLMNVFGSLAVAGMLVMGGAGVAEGTQNITQSGPISGYPTSGQIGTRGGALFIRGSAGSQEIIVNSSIDGLTFSNNRATNQSGNAYGGAISGSRAVLTITNSTFTGNTVKGSTLSAGGAVANSRDTTIQNTNFIGNYQSGGDDKYSGGGAVYGDTNSSITIEGGIFENNLAEKKGGAIKADNNLTISGGTQFINNTSGLAGGAIDIANTGAEIAIEDATFTGNQAGGEGGAIFYRPTTSLRTH